MCSSSWEAATSRRLLSNLLGLSFDGVHGPWWAHCAIPQKEVQQTAVTGLEQKSLRRGSNDDDDDDDDECKLLSENGWFSYQTIDVC